MAGIIINYVRNHDNSDTTRSGSYSSSAPCPTIETLGWSAPSGKVFKEWNQYSDGSGISMMPGDVVTTVNSDRYAIWEDAAIDYLTTNQEITSIANAIRAKAEIDWSLVYPTGFINAINAIQTGERGIKYAKFEMTASDTFTFVEGYPLTYSELLYDCFFCGGALSPDDSDIAYISGHNNEGFLMFGFLPSQYAVPADILDYNNGIITIDNIGTLEQGYLYAFIPDFDFDENIATMSEFKSYLGIT